MMNAYQKASNTLDILLGTQGRAIWMAARLDEVPVRAIAKEHELSTDVVREIVLNCDYVIELADIAPKEERTGVYHPCYEGFHQMGDGE
jgi:hypothetical protein